MNISPLAGKLHMPSQQKTKKDTKQDVSPFFNRFSQTVETPDRKMTQKSDIEQAKNVLGSGYECYSQNVIEQIPQTHNEVQAVVTTKLRYLAYEQSDYIQVDLPNGCTYRAKVDVSAYQVYIECRTDEGDMEGYMADINAISESTKDALEQMALTSWNKVLEENRKLFGIVAGDTQPEGRTHTYPHWKEVPYGHLADEMGVISYKGVNFICDPEKHAICLGDMSNQANVLTIPLSSGGSLKVNRENIGDLMQAITMFSAEDRERIMRAIEQDKRAQQLKQEIEDEKSELFQ